MPICPPSEPGAWIERFDYFRVTGDWALLHLRARLSASADGPSAHLLAASPVGAEVCARASRAGHEQRLTGVRPGAELVWRASFALPLTFVESSAATLTLVGDDGVAWELPAPRRRTVAQRSLALRAAADERRRATPAGASRRLVAAATAAALTGTSTPAVALAASASDDSTTTSVPAPSTQTTTGTQSTPGDRTDTTAAGSTTAPAPSTATTTTTTTTTTSSTAAPTPSATTSTTPTTPATSTTPSTPEPTPAPRPRRTIPIRIPHAIVRTPRAVAHPKPHAAPKLTHLFSTHTATTHAATTPVAHPHTGETGSTHATCPNARTSAIDAALRAARMSASDGSARDCAGIGSRRHAADPQPRHWHGAITPASTKTQTTDTTNSQPTNSGTPQQRAAGREAAQGAAAQHSLAAAQQADQTLAEQRRSARRAEGNRLAALHAGIRNIAQANGERQAAADERRAAIEAAEGVAPLPTPSGMPRHPIHLLSPTGPGQLAPTSWTGSVLRNPALTGAVRNLSGVLANGDRPPSFLIPIYLEAARRYDVRWEVLAAINAVETDYGRNLNTSSAGAVGWMQFMPSTWREYGVAADGHSVANPYDPRDAIFAAAKYLKAAGGSENIERAVFSYNHAGWYVDEVMHRAERIASRAQWEKVTVHRGTVSVRFRTGLTKHPYVTYRSGRMSHYDRMIAAANMVSAANFAYSWGGGHEQPAQWGPFDCSGSVSYVMQQAGYALPTSTSGSIGNWNLPTGPGKVTIFFNPTHTFMRIGNRFFGTSGFARPGGGAGWFDVDRLPASYLAGFSEVHVPELGSNSYSATTDFAALAIQDGMRTAHTIEDIPPWIATHARRPMT